MNRSCSLPLLVTTLSCLWLATSEGRAQEALEPGLRLESLRGEVAAACSRSGWRPLALEEVSAAPLRLGPSARAELRQGGASLVASSGARLQAEAQGLRLERGQLLVHTGGQAYRVATRAGALVLRGGQLEVAALTSGVFARVGPKSQAEFSGEGGPARPLSQRWTRLAPWGDQDPVLPTPPTWPELPVALRDIHGLQAERVEVVGVDARVDLEAGFARSVWRLTLRSPSGSRIEAVTPLPLPLGATVTDLWVGEPQGRSAYVVRGLSRNHGFAQGQDLQLALLEWSRGDVARLSVAPVTSEVTVTLRSVEPLPLEGGRYRYALPLGRPAWRGLERVRCELRSPNLDRLRANRPLGQGLRDSRLVLVHASSRAPETPWSSQEDLVVWAEPPALALGEVGLEVFAEGQPAAGPRAYLARVRPNLAPVQVHPERVFLVDTSLAPTPEAFAARVLALETLLDELPDEDPFALLAFDSTSAALTPGFVRGAAAKRQALARLRARGSLGASDLEGGLLAAAELCRRRAPGQLVLISAGPPCFGELRATALGRVARERFLGWSISALALGELRSEAHLEAIVAGRGLILAAPSRAAGSAAFRLAHALEFLEATLQVGFASEGSQPRALPAGGQLVLRGREGPGVHVLKLSQVGHAPRQLPWALPAGSASGVAALVTRDEALAEPHRELLAAFRREVRGEPDPTKSTASLRVLLPQAALSAGSERYAIWPEFMEPRFKPSPDARAADPRSDGDPLWKLDLDRLVRGRANARIDASTHAALALETYYRVERATEAKGDDPLPWPKENREPLGEPKAARISVATLAPPASPILPAPHPDLQLARRRGAEIEAELAAPPAELEALYLERAPRRISASSHWDQSWNRRYLVQVANPDGSWGAPPSLVLTSRAIRSFVGNGHTHRFGTFKRTVNKAYVWLKSRQRPDGGFGQNAYEHALVSAVMFELLWVSRDFKLRGPSARALAHLVGLQNPDGSWGGGEGESRPRASVEAVQVLKLASMGSDNKVSPAVAPALARALPYLNSITSPDGAVGPLGLPRGNEIDLTLTAEVATARVLAGTPCWDPRVRAAGAHLLTLTRRSATTWYQEAFPRDGYHLLRVGTELFFQIGGTAWPRWAKWMQEVLLPQQVARGLHDGSWSPPRDQVATAEAPAALPTLLANPVLSREGEATPAALSSLCQALARVDDRARLESWRTSEGLPPASRACAGARLALLSEDAGQPLTAADDWLQTWQAAGQSPAADRFLLRATSLWERERGGGYALLRLLEAPCRPERFSGRLEILLDVLLRQPERARRELIRGLPTQRPFEARIRTALLAALTGLEQDPIRQAALLENLAALVGREAPWERLATAYLAVGDPRGLEIRRALVVGGQQDLQTLVRLRRDAIEHLDPGEDRQRAATSELQIHWDPSDANAEVLDDAFGAGAGLDLRLAGFELPHYAQSDLGDVLLELAGSGRDEATELALALMNRRDLTFESREERRLRGIHFDESPQLQAALNRVLQNEVEVVVAWENEESQVEFEVQDLEGSRISGVVDEEEGRTLFLRRRESSPVRVRVKLPEGQPATRVHIKITQGRGAKRAERLWVFMLEEGSATRSLADR